MPVYEYLCGSCQHQFEHYQSIRDDSLTTCTSCGDEALARVLFPPTVFDATPKTLGGQADKNCGPGRTYWREKQQHDFIESRTTAAEQLRQRHPNLVSDTTPSYERPWWRKSDTINMKLADLTPREQVNYIQTGKTTDPITPSI